jgi:signal transduction histidine kinase/ActR/RegA family two-component response regulator
MRRTGLYVVGGLVILGIVLGSLFLRRGAIYDRTYRIGFEDDPPFHFRDPQGQPAGLAIDIVNEAARRKGIRLQWSYQAMSSEAALRGGAVDLWPIMTILPERKPYIYFTDPYRVSEACLLVRTDRPFQKPGDLDGRTIWFNGQPLGRRVLSAALPNAKLAVLEDARGLIERVCRGEADAAYMDEFTVISELMHGADCVGTTLRPITVPLSRGQLGIGATFEAASAADVLRDAISEMADDGSLSDVVGRWTHFTGRSMELNSELIQAQRRERLMIGATVGAVSLLLLATWLTLRIRHQRNRLVRAEAAQRAGEEERSRLADQLQQAQRMESIGRLAGGVAHDFNNLLTVISGYTDMLLAEESLTDDQRAQLRQISAAGTQAANLTQQLLAFSRKQVIQPRPLNLNTVVQDTSTMLRRLVGENIELTTDLEPGLQPIMADPSQVRQFLMNLVINGRDAMPGGGKLVIKTANVVVDDAAAATHPEAAPGAYAVVSVSDTGVGMDAETLGHIFEPFFTTKAKGEGTGLGLSMVYGIVKQGKGWIATASQPGRGTTFTVYLPQIQAEPSILAEAPGTASNRSGTETVLLVEDQASVRSLAASVLRGFGYRLIEAESGEEALAAAGRDPSEIHLLLTDVVLPGMTGKDLADRLKDTRPRMKVLFTSGYAEDVIAHRGVLSPGIRYLPKPFAPNVLAKAVREVLDRAHAAGTS